MLDGFGELDDDENNALEYWLGRNVLPFRIIRRGSAEPKCTTNADRGAVPHRKKAPRERIQHGRFLRPSTYYV